MQAPDLHRRDIHVVLAEKSANPADETGLVLVLREQEVALDRHVDPEAVDEHDSRVTLHKRSGDLGRSDLHREERRIARRLGLTALGDHEAARPREVESVHEVDPLLAEGLEHAFHSGGAERLRVELEDRAAVRERELRRPVIEELSRERSKPLRETQGVVRRMHLGVVVEIDVSVSAGTAAPPLDPSGPVVQLGVEPASTRDAIRW